MGTVTRFPNMPDDYEPNTLLEEAKNLDLTDVLIVGWKPNGTLYVQSSKMTRAEALFMNEVTRKHIMEA